MINYCGKVFVFSKRGHAQVLTSDISCENVDPMRVRITFQIRIIFQYDFLIIKALEMNFYILKFAIRILNHCGK